MGSGAVPAQVVISAPQEGAEKLAAEECTIMPTRPSACDTPGVVPLLARRSLVRATFRGELCLVLSRSASAACSAHSGCSTRTSAPSWWPSLLLSASVSLVPCAAGLLMRLLCGMAVERLSTDPEATWRLN